jgi:hypothetical protein
MSAIAHRSYKPDGFTGPLPQGLPTLSWPSFEADEIEAATRVLRSGKVNYWTGCEGKEFE